ncbi:transposase [Salicibibacter cibi]|uniref:Transposase n=1 Tax=Salicibibacter cibi TaxID=2743001 RepID=A0A7T7CG74_9BACI|nr:transposase [Salicibibacter cibi]QQK80729.1 transposase [Salicibibacter cibi]
MQHHDIEFKRYAVKLIVHEGKKRADVAREHGISDSTLENWVRNYREDKGDALFGNGYLTPAEKQHQRDMKRIEELEEEVAILKKAAAFFAKNQA